MTELIGSWSGLGWVAVKAVLMFAIAVIGFRLGERRTLAQLSAFDFAVAVAVGAIIGRTATSPTTSFVTGAVALVTLLVAHRLVAAARRRGWLTRAVDSPPRVLVANGELQQSELATAGLTTGDVFALLRQQGVGDVREVRFLLYETKGAVSLVRDGEQVGPVVRDGLAAAGFADAA